MKVITFLGAAVLLIVASLAVACGDDDGDEVDSTGGSGGSGGVAGGGLVRPDTFLTYDGKRYELVNMLFGDMVDEGQFEQIGEATEADLDLLGDARVFRRSGDTTSVFTHSAPTADDGEMWLAWRPAD